MSRENIRSAARAGWRGWGSIALCLLVLAAIVYTIWFFPAAGPVPTDRSHDPNQPIPVLTAIATSKDVPIYLDGLGTVQAFYTVNIKAMVDGPLISVNFKEGEDVHKGDVLAEIDPRTYQAALDSAVAKKAQDRAQLDNARVDLVRYQKLVQSNYASAQQADTAKAKVAEFQALVDQDQAQIDTARTQLSYTTITAPIDGRAGIRQVDPGNIVHATDTTHLVVLTELQPISVLFTLPQQALPAVAAAMARGKTPVLALPQDTSTVAAPQTLDAGTLTVLDNQVDPTTGTIKLKATFPNEGLRLWPGGFVRIRLRTEVRNNAVVVPPAAIQRGPRGPYVFVVVDGQTATRQAVKVGYEDEQTSVVTQGMKPGDVVVVDGTSRLSEGSKVNAMPSDAQTLAASNEPTAPGTRRPLQRGTE